MKYCDLHNHSICSDGTYTPEKLVKYACEKGISAIGLTDHNTTDGMESFIKSAKEYGIEYVFGTELTTDYSGKEVHLLCLFITPENAHIIRLFTNEQLENKKVSNEKLSSKLLSAGYDVDFEKLKETYGENINRAHFARALVDKGYMESTEIAFNTILRPENGFYDPPKRVGLINAIKMVREWGCVPVIAHPLLSVTKEELERLLPKAIRNGLCGMEVYYPKFNDEQKEYLHALCQKYNLVASGGYAALSLTIIPT